MTEIEKLINEKIRILEDSPDRLADASIKAQKFIWESVSVEIDKFEIKDGKIVLNASNVSQLEKIIESLKSAIYGTDFQKAMKAFIADFDHSARITNTLAKDILSSFEPSLSQDKILNIVRQNTVNTLIGDGLAARLTQPFVTLLAANVSAGSSLLETRKSLREFVLGTPDADGKLLSNIRTNSGTALAVADAGYSKAVANEIGAEWFRYAGTVIDTTRPFCKERAGKYFHKKEIEAWADLDKWSGEIDGTNSETIFNFRGGWNCRHSINMVSIFRVPAETIQRNIANGNHTEKK